MPYGFCGNKRGREQGGWLGRITACRFASGTKDAVLTRIASICILAGDCRLGGHGMPLTAQMHNPAHWNVCEKHGLSSGPPPGNPAM
eukprot:scaffold738_cov340-Pavlova_lutheri.AAC.12